MKALNVAPTCEVRALPLYANSAGIQASSKLPLSKLQVIPGDIVAEKLVCVYRLFVADIRPFLWKCGMSPSQQVLIQAHKGGNPINLKVCRLRSHPAVTAEHFKL